MTTRQELEVYKTELENGSTDKSAFMSEDRYYRFVSTCLVDTALEFEDSKLESLTMDKALFEAAKLNFAGNKMIKFID